MCIIKPQKGRNLCTMVAPVARAMRLLSVLRRRRMADTPALVRKCVAKSDRPFSVTTRSGLWRVISAHARSMYSSSSFSRAALRAHARQVIIYGTKIYDSWTLERRRHLSTPPWSCPLCMLWTAGAIQSLLRSRDQRSLVSKVLPCTSKS